MTNTFLRREGSFNIYQFECPCCEASGELGMDKDCTRLIDHGCGTLFIQQPPVGMYAVPRLVTVTEGAKA